MTPIDAYRVRMQMVATQVKARRLFLRTLLPQHYTTLHTHTAALHAELAHVRALVPLVTPRAQPWLWPDGHVTAPDDPLRLELEQ